MNKYIVSLRVQVEVEAMSPSHAEKLAFERADALRRSDKAVVTSAEYVRESK